MLLLGAGGGGGSSYISIDATLVSDIQGNNSGYGRIVIEYALWCVTNLVTNGNFELDTTVNDYTYMFP